VALRVYLRYLDADGIGRRMHWLAVLNRALMRCMVFSAESEYGRRLRELNEEKKQ
jgi:hypothetical protein